MRRTRFAPAPTGVLHLGHVASAMYVWGIARAHGAQVLLRIEDHDAERCRPEYERAILDDLDWLGFAPDILPVTRQSDRQHHYARVADELRQRGLIYGCTCSRQQIAEISPADSDGERRYPGTCRTRGISLAGSEDPASGQSEDPASGNGVAWRLRMDPGEESFTDLLVGPQTQDPSTQCGDLVIKDRLGNWTYQFVASVDDFLQDIDLIVRGQDLLASTGRQIRVARLVGRERPATFAHHPLVMKTPAQKLSKSDRDTGTRDWRGGESDRSRLARESVRARGDRVDRGPDYPSFMLTGTSGCFQAA